MIMHLNQGIYILILTLMTYTLTTAKRARPIVYSTTSSKLTTPLTSRGTPAIRWRRCPHECRCNARRREVNCSFQGLSKVPKGIPKSVRSLILTGNKFQHIPNNSFRYLSHLEILELNGNNLQTVSARWFRHLRKLKRLNLSINNIEHLPQNAFRKLTNLKILLLRKNKLGKLPANVFLALKNIAEIDLSQNALQTLEVDMFDGMHSLRDLYLSTNKWHCDCQLKTLEIALRNRDIKTGYVVCDSPKKLQRTHLRNDDVDSLCGVDSTTLTAILVGGTCAGIIVLFSIFMCRKHAALNLEVNDSTVTKTKSFKVRKRSTSDSSLTSVESGKGKSQAKKDEQVDILNTSFDLNASVLSPLTTKVDNDHRQVHSNSKIKLVSAQASNSLSSSFSCPKF
ncbi:uncharacterized protein LOC143453127 [Clavelina lepadiformis]|uniref:uncharacterized protein LOC143453127 n=1 Tax=Clavelina lepadiformis TaxID=159417 RepID=UPI0040416994